MVCVMRCCAIWVLGAPVLQKNQNGVSKGLMGFRRDYFQVSGTATIVKFEIYVSTVRGCQREVLSFDSF